MHENPETVLWDHFDQAPPQHEQLVARPLHNTLEIELDEFGLVLTGDFDRGAPGNQVHIILLMVTDGKECFKRFSSIVPISAVSERERETATYSDNNHLKLR